MTQQTANDTTTEPGQSIDPYLAGVIHDLAGWITGARHFRSNPRIDQRTITAHNDDRSGLKALLVSFAAAILATVWRRVDEKVVAAVKAELDARAVVAPTCVFFPGEFEDAAVAIMQNRDQEWLCVHCNKRQSEHVEPASGAVSPPDAQGGVSDRFVGAIMALNLLLHGTPARSIIEEVARILRAALSGYERDASAAVVQVGEMAEKLASAEAEVVCVTAERDLALRKLGKWQIEATSLTGELRAAVKGAEDAKEDLENLKDAMNLLEAEFAQARTDRANMAAEVQAAQAELAASPRGRAATPGELFEAFQRRWHEIDGAKGLSFAAIDPIAQESWRAVATEAARIAGLAAPTPESGEAAPPQPVTKREGSTPPSAMFSCGVCGSTVARPDTDDCKHFVCGNGHPTPPPVDEDASLRREKIRNLATLALHGHDMRRPLEVWQSCVIGVPGLKLVEIEDAMGQDLECSERNGSDLWSLRRPAEPEQGAPAPTPKADAEAMVGVLFGRPGKAADDALAHLYQHLGRQPNVYEIRAVHAHQRAVCAELAERAGTIAAARPS